PTIHLIALLLAVVGYLVQHQITSHQINLHELLAQVLPSVSGSSAAGAFQAVERALGGVLRLRGQLTLFGLPLFLWFSTRLFGGLRAALNEVFATDERRSWPAAKLLDFLMVVLTGVFLVPHGPLSAYQARNAAAW